MKKKELNIEEIKNLIPHRYPFLLIDKLINIIPDTSATGIKNVTFNERLLYERLIKVQVFFYILRRFIRLGTLMLI